MLHVKVQTKVLTVEFVRGLDATKGHVGVVGVV